MICSSWLGKHRAGLKGFLAGHLQRIVLRDLDEQFLGAALPLEATLFPKVPLFHKIAPLEWSRGAWAARSLRRDVPSNPIVPSPRGKPVRSPGVFVTSPLEALPGMPGRSPACPKRAAPNFHPANEAAATSLNRSSSRHAIHPVNSDGISHQTPLREPERCRGMPRGGFGVPPLVLKDVAGCDPTSRLSPSASNS